jgi:hypothetical protein
MNIDALAKLVFIVAMFWAAMTVSVRLSIRIQSRNRAAEFPENARSEELAPQELHWTLVHIRDDVGGIYAILSVTNGLLAALLAVGLIWIAGV